MTVAVGSHGWLGSLRREMLRVLACNAHMSDSRIDRVQLAPMMIVGPPVVAKQPNAGVHYTHAPNIQPL